MTQQSRIDLHESLKKFFGFDEFRPHQAEIVGAMRAGEDLVALLPTGGGKSLCYQLPALLTEGLTVVVSPLIALMQDQVGQLEAAGLPAAFLNSTLDAAGARERFAKLHRGELKLLYLAPERLLLPQFLETLRGWGVARFVIDEAHCISEWGHDFRPEYRQLSALRKKFPEVPFAAFTATATERVREDIRVQLAMAAPREFVASFNRPNLSYRVVAREKGARQLAEFIRARKGESGIVYVQSRAAAERLAGTLREAGVAARPYHAGLDAEIRRRHQEEFRRDQITVMVATIAFGMGVHKPDIRFVVHHDLPKSIEGYYQETGRAGRDGEPADCLLLYSRGDLMKLQRFLDEVSDPEEKAHAAAMLRKMADYAELAGCRRRALLAHFGEEFPAGSCGGCDNCLAPPEPFDATEPARKLLSAVARVRQHSRFAVGMGHLADILRGGDTEKIRNWGHDRLTVHGIGRELAKSDWLRIGRELVRLGLLAQSADSFGTLSLTQAGLAALKENRPVTLTRWAGLALPGEKAAREKTRGVEGSADPALFERLRALRRRLAEARGVPPYFIFSDAALRAMTAARPADAAAFAGIPGVGEKKLREFAADFLREINAQAPA